MSFLFYLTLSCFVYAVFGLVGIFVLKEIKFLKKNFSKKQNLIYCSIFYLVFSFFLGQADQGNTGIPYQIGYGIGNYGICWMGAVIATWLAMKYKFAFNDKFYMSLFGSILGGTILFTLIGATG